MDFRNVQLKVCGLTRTEDIAVAASRADWFGVIVYPGSPRAVSWELAADLLHHIPAGRGVCVDVNPTPDTLAERAGSGFGAFQIHFPSDTPDSRLRAWSEAVGRDRLWLAPHVHPGTPFPKAVLEWADTILLDAYDPNRFGGSGKTGDWRYFQELQAQYPDHRWILAGGLRPDNVVEAIAASNAHFIDVNSGVESAPGIKDHGKLRSLFERLTSGDAK